MIVKIAADVANKVNVIPSMDFEGMVGMEARLKKVNSYLQGECNEVKMIGIQGPAGIGKTTIARALFNQLSADFELKCFIDLKESYRSDGIDVKHEWEHQLSKLENSLDKKIEDVLKVGYDKLSKKDKSLFLHIAFFFNNEAIDHVTTMLAESNLDFRNGLKTLADKSLVRISTTGWIQMHRLLQQLGRQVVQEQSDDPGKRQFLVDAQEIRDVLVNETGTGSVVGISFDMSKISGELFITGHAFEGMPSLRFLRIYGRYFGKYATLDMSEDITYLPCLRLLHWDSYPSKRLPLTFRPECLIELRMKFSKLEKLWGGIQFNLESFKEVDKSSSSRFGSAPSVSMNIKYLNVGNTKMEEVHPSIVERLPHLKWLRLGGRNVNRITHVPQSVRHLNLSSSVIETIPDCVISLPQLESLFVYNCRQLVSLEGLPLSLKYIDASNCVSLERVSFSFNYLITHFMFRNCLNLDEESRREVIQQRGYNNVWLPGREIPAEFTHKAIGNSIRLVDGEGALSAYSGFKACLVLPPAKKYVLLAITCRIRTKEGVFIKELKWNSVNYFHYKTKHLFICGGNLVGEIHEVDVTAREILLEFSCSDNQRIIACGVRILNKEEESSSGGNVANCDYRADGDGDNKSEATQVSRFENTKGGEHTCCWSWLQNIWPGEENDEEDKTSIMVRR
ncbi:hypothetical protein IGI04_039599 [Brassica rapa subsp. trilocularis]|uniref:NB-ARC domain-containing protein n=1 Tax=Brassica rapa subsp. trilocularis TaxID=1813537 RepID=A0ABQ7KLB5_BRACM|nr:hypothetical protein IGI04_039599 [Brassica rapa subsp. trilocularis]